MERSGAHLAAAEKVLGETDDYVTLGNIQSFYGRMARRRAVSIRRLSFSRAPLAITASAIHGIRIWRDR